MDTAQTLLKEVQEYYGETLKTSADLCKQIHAVQQDQFIPKPKSKL